MNRPSRTRGQVNLDLLMTKLTQHASRLDRTIDGDLTEGLATFAAQLETAQVPQPEIERVLIKLGEVSVDAAVENADAKALHRAMVMFGCECAFLPCTCGKAATSILETNLPHELGLPQRDIHGDEND